MFIICINFLQIFICWYNVLWSCQHAIMQAWHHLAATAAFGWPKAGHPKSDCFHTGNARDHPRALVGLPWGVTPTEGYPHAKGGPEKSRGPRPTRFFAGKIFVFPAQKIGSRTQFFDSGGSVWQKQAEKCGLRLPHRPPLAGGRPGVPDPRPGPVRGVRDPPEPPIWGSRTPNLGGPRPGQGPWYPRGVPDTPRVSPAMTGPGPPARGRSGDGKLRVRGGPELLTFHVHFRGSPTGTPRIAALSWPGSQNTDREPILLQVSTRVPDPGGKLQKNRVLAGFGRLGPPPGRSPPRRIGPWPIRAIKNPGNLGFPDIFDRKNRQPARFFPLFL